MVQNFLFILIFRIIFYLKTRTLYSRLVYFLGSDLISYGLIILRVWICALIIIARELVFKKKNHVIFF